MSDTPVILSVSPALHQRLAELHEITGIKSPEELLTLMAKVFKYVACPFPETTPEVLLNIQQEATEFYRWAHVAAERGNTIAEVEVVSMDAEGMGVCDIFDAHLPPSLELIRNNALGEARRKRIFKSAANLLASTPAPAP